MMMKQYGGGVKSILCFNAVANLHHGLTAGEKKSVTMGWPVKWQT